MQLCQGKISSPGCMAKSVSAALHLIYYKNDQTLSLRYVSSIGWEGEVFLSVCLLVDSPREPNSPPLQESRFSHRSAIGTEQSDWKWCDQSSPATSELLRLVNVEVSFSIVLFKASPEGGGLSARLPFCPPRFSLLPPPLRLTSLKKK